MTLADPADRHCRRPTSIDPDVRRRVVERVTQSVISRRLKGSWLPGVEQRGVFVDDMHKVTRREVKRDSAQRGTCMLD